MTDVEKIEIRLQNLRDLGEVLSSYEHPNVRQKIQDKISALEVELADAKSAADRLARMKPTF